MIIVWTSCERMPNFGPFYLLVALWYSSVSSFWFWPWYATPRVTTTADDFSRCFHHLGNKTLSVKKQPCHATFEILQYRATSVKLITLWILKKNQDGLEFVLTTSTYLEWRYEIYNGGLRISWDIWMDLVAETSLGLGPVGPLGPLNPPEPTPVQEALADRTSWTLLRPGKCMANATTPQRLLYGCSSQSMLELCVAV
jgi:hypothetical protein